AGTCCACWTRSPPAEPLEEPPRVRVRDAVDLLLAEARPTEAPKRIVIRGRKAVVGADQELVDADTAGEESQGLRVVEQRVVGEPSEVRRRRRHGCDPAPLAHAIE